MNKVTTTSTCGRCGAQEVEEGAHGDFPPVGWARTSLTRRHEGSGWTNHTNLFDDALCPACQEVVLEALKPPVRNEWKHTHGANCACGSECESGCDWCRWARVHCVQAEAPDVDA